jgi:hypothetical protein
LLYAYRGAIAAVFTTGAGVVALALLLVGWLPEKPLVGHRTEKP